MHVKKIKANKCMNINFSVTKKWNAISNALKVDERSHTKSVYKNFKPIENVVSE